ncbi:hypothetical protein GCM10007111_25180 [Virgibacillus kapii]|uniref:Uncharacterized protein n=1 Tax=Virgibacillus kapii TaxID=1638645 RepID=A0ABQ2DKY4_9BACI|nr:hypothetical protein GCM10007111_25180 [Virgibacillus kapii]
MEDMTIGSCLDFVDEYIEQRKPDKEKKARQAKQADFDSF